VHILINVSLLGSLFSEMVDLRDERRTSLKRYSMLHRRLDPGLLASLDKDGNGVDKTEFVVGLLVELELVAWEEVEPFIAQFEILDVDGTNFLTADDLHNASRTETCVRQAVTASRASDAFMRSQRQRLAAAGHKRLQGAIKVGDQMEKSCRGAADILATTQFSPFRRARSAGCIRHAALSPTRVTQAAASVGPHRCEDDYAKFGISGPPVTGVPRAMPNRQRSRPTKSLTTTTTGEMVSAREGIPRPPPVLVPLSRSPSPGPPSRRSPCPAANQWPRPQHGQKWTAPSERSPGSRTAAGPVHSPPSAASAMIGSMAPNSRTVTHFQYV